MTVDQLKETKARYTNMKNRNNKVVANSMRKKRKKRIQKYERKSNYIFRLAKFMKRERKDIGEIKSIRGKDGKLDFNEKDRNIIWKNSWR